MSQQQLSSPEGFTAESSILEQSSSLLAAIIESSEDAIISKDLNGMITSWNHAAGRMYGYTPEEIIGQSILRLIPKELYPEEDEILRKLRAGERIEHYETTRVAKDGRRLDVSLTISPIRGSSGRIIGSSKIARDITSRKQMERSLVQAQQLAAAGRMAATIAHEINNPLESVLNLIFLARDICPPDSEVRGYLKTAEQEIERVSHIARQTLGFYRDTGAPIDVSVGDLLNDVLAVYRSKLNAKNIDVTCQFDVPRPIKASRGELVQIFSNIVANSVDAMPRGGLLQIRAVETSDDRAPGIEITIKDQGVGIPEKDVGKIFEPFFTTKNNVGTGIGLWVAKQLVEKHGGEITVSSSTAPGNTGTTVRIHLPFSGLMNDPQPKSTFNRDLCDGMSRLRQESQADTRARDSSVDGSPEIQPNSGSERKTHPGGHVLLTHQAI